MKSRWQASRFHGSGALSRRQPREPLRRESGSRPRSNAHLQARPLPNTTGVLISTLAPGVRRCYRLLRPNGKRAMGEIHADVTLENPGDRAVVERGHGQESDIRRSTIDAIVDTGAVTLVLPQNVVERLGLEQRGTAFVTYADERREERPLAGPVTVRISTGSTRPPSTSPHPGTASWRAAPTRPSRSGAPAPAAAAP